MPALPPSTNATNSAATEGDVKNFLTGMRDFLSGLFGTSGLPADARAALGIDDSAKVASFNTRTGSVTLSAADVATAYPNVAQAVVSVSYNGQTDDGTWKYFRFTRANGTYFDVNISYNYPSGGGGS